MTPATSMTLAASLPISTPIRRSMPEPPPTSLDVIPTQAMTSQRRFSIVAPFAAPFRISIDEAQYGAVPAALAAMPVRGLVYCGYLVAPRVLGNDGGCVHGSAALQYRRNVSCQLSRSMAMQGHEPDHGELTASLAGGGRAGAA
jgi:hypothetical protein